MMMRMLMLQSGRENPDDITRWSDALAQTLLARCNVAKVPHLNSTPTLVSPSIIGLQSHARYRNLICQPLRYLDTIRKTFSDRSTVHRAAQFAAVFTMALQTSLPRQSKFDRESHWGQTAHHGLNHLAR